MSYSICRIEKIKSGGVTGIQIHDRREKNVSHTNKDIDWSRTHENITLIERQGTFRHAVKQRIKELDLKRAIRKDATVMVQVMITSDKAFFDGMTKPEQVEFMKKSYEFIKDRYGEKNLVSAIIHMDEKTPHLHVNFVPITEDGRLSAKDLFGPKDLRKLQDDFNRYCRENGYDLERGDPGSKAKHIEMAEFKKRTADKELKKVQSELDLHVAAAENLKKTVSKSSVERDKLIQEINALQDSFKSLKNDYERVKGVKFVFDEINSIESKFEPLNKDIVKIKSSDFEKLKDIAKNFRLHEIELENLYQELNDLSERDIERERELNSLRLDVEVVKNFLADTNRIDEFIEYRDKFEQINNLDLDYDPDHEL